MNTTSSPSRPTDVTDVAPYVADAATRLTDRVPELVSAIAAMVRDESRSAFWTTGMPRWSRPNSTVGRLAVIRT